MGNWTCWWSVREESVPECHARVVRVEVVGDVERKIPRQRFSSEEKEGHATSKDRGRKKAPETQRRASKARAKETSQHPGHARGGMQLKVSSCGPTGCCDRNRTILSRPSPLVTRESGPLSLIVDSGPGWAVGGRWSGLCVTASEAFGKRGDQR